MVKCGINNANLQRLKQDSMCYIHWNEIPTISHAWLHICTQTNIYITQVVMLKSFTYILQSGLSVSKIKVSDKKLPW